MTTPDDVVIPDTGRILPILEFDELIELFGYANERAARRAMRLKKFPVPTFKLAGRTVAHVDVVKRYFDEKYDEGVTDLKLRAGLPTGRQTD